MIAECPVCHAQRTETVPCRCGFFLRPEEPPRRADGSGLLVSEATGARGSAWDRNERERDRRAETQPGLVAALRKARRDIAGICCVTDREQVERELDEALRAAGEEVDG